MEDKLRPSGIDVIGSVPWGTHFCQFYHTKQDLIDILVPYFKAGLENNEFCMWITSEPLIVAEAQEAMREALEDFDGYLRRGQIEIIPYDEWYLLGGTFDDDRVLAGWVSKLERALAGGYSGLRLTGNTFWLERNHWQAFTEYEAEVNDVIGRYRMVAICTYCLAKCDGAAVIDVVKNHQFALIKQEGKWDIIESAIYKQAKERIAHLALFPELNPNPVLEMDIAGNIKYLNPATEALFPDLPSRGSQYPFLTDWDILLRTLRERESHTLTRDIKVGESWYEQSYVLIPSTGDVRIYARDITESKHAEEALRRSEKDLNHAQEVAHVGSWRLDVQRDQLLWSDETHRIFGIPKETPMTYETFLLSVHPEDREYVEQNWTAALCGEPYDIEHRIIVGDEVKWVRERAELEFDAQGFLKGGFGTAQDITEMKIIQEALRQSEANYRTLVESAPDGVASMDAEGRIANCNEAFCNLLGYNIEEVRGRHISELATGPTKERAESYHTQLAQKGRVTDEFEAMGKYGQSVPLWIKAVVLPDREGKPTQTIIYARDITERKKLEQLKDEFIGLVSHELRTPLTVISGCLSTVLTEWDHLPSGEAQQLLQDAALESESLSHLVENLLELSRFQAQQLALYTEPTDIKTVVREALDKIKRQAPSQKFSISIPDKLPMVHVDPLRIERILYNLLENSAKYSPPGGQIKVTAQAEPKRLVIGISDQGRGLSRDEQARIFGAFQRLESSRPDQARGIGLGLLVCRRLVEAHGGEMWVESEKDRGSTFFFTLPFGKSMDAVQG